MSCIDAAIIKALVEHIGMNPDEIGGSASNTLINATWTTVEYENENRLAFTLPEGETITIGTRLRLPCSDPDKTVLNLYCVQITTDGHYYFRENNGVYGGIAYYHRMYNCYVSDYTCGVDSYIPELPDNKNFGFFKSTSFDVLAPVINYIKEEIRSSTYNISGIQRQIDAIESEVETLKSYHQ